jgi:sulfopyruvate decarboxylase subunit alpha
MAAGEEVQQYARLFMQGLKEAGVSLVAALPDSLLKSIYRECARDNAIRYIPVSNEGDLPGLCAGAYLVGKRALMIMENSGIRQACEPLARFALGRGVPMVMVLSYRGEFGEKNWWGHNHAQTMIPILEALQITYHYVSKLDDIKPSIKKAFDHADSSQMPVALIFSGECVERTGYA